MVAPASLPFNVGDRVKIVVDVNALKLLQDGHGGWNPKMAEVSDRLLSDLLL